MFAVTLLIVTWITTLNKCPPEYESGKRQQIPSFGFGGRNGIGVI